MIMFIQSLQYKAYIEQLLRKQQQIIKTQDVNIGLSGRILMPPKFLHRFIFLSFQVDVEQ